MTSWILALALIAAAPAPKERNAPAGDGDHPLIGDWVVESHVSSGRRLARIAGKAERITITRDRWIVSGAGKSDANLSLNPKKVPPHIDVWVPRQGDEMDVNCRGIYKLDGDTLIVSYRLGKERPTGFESTVGSGIMVITLKRTEKD